jgi:hypothetical protein
MWREEVKFVDVGSRCAFSGFEPVALPTDSVLETGKNDEEELSAYCCAGCTCAIDRLRAGDAAEDLACAMLAEEPSPQACDWRAGRHSVSEDETREPEPVLPSESAVAPANVLLPSREAAAPAKAEPIGLLFQMLLAQGIELKEDRSLSVLLRETPPEKSRFRDCETKVSE